MTLEFSPWPKTARLFRDMILTEKIDGTNAAVGIKSVNDFNRLLDEDGSIMSFLGADQDNILWYDDEYVVYAQSRSRLINIEQDNFGFARWVRDNAETLVEDLGEGLHFGEWWGSGIQRGYGLQKGERYFSLFNVRRYTDGHLLVAGDEEAPQNQAPFITPNLRVVPILLPEFEFNTSVIGAFIGMLRDNGSYLQEAPGFKAEGVVVFHTAANMVFKVTVENDEKPKGSNE